jgi:hypothetical protein
MEESGVDTHFFEIEGASHTFWGRFPVQKTWRKCVISSSP